MATENDDVKVSAKKYTTDKSQTIRKMWEAIARRPSEFDMEVIDALKATIIKTNENNITYGCYGENIYQNIRQQLINFKSSDGKKVNFLLTDIINTKEKADKPVDNSKKKEKVQEKVQEKTKDKPIKKADLIRIEATNKKLNERLITILNSFNLSYFIIPSEAVIYSDILEMRAIGFIYMIWFICKNKSKYISPEDKIIPFSIIVSLQRFISLINGYIGFSAINTQETMNIASTLIDDLSAMEKYVIKLYNYNGITLYQQASDLILGSAFDVYLPKKAREAFEHQKKVSDTIMNVEKLKNGFKMDVCTMTNSGKTSTIINIATAVAELRKKYPSVFGKLQVLATCDVAPVLSRWGQLLYHANLPFGIGAKRFYPNGNMELCKKIQKKALQEMAEDKDCVDIEMRFSNSDTCKSIAERLCIVCPTDIALKILKQAPNASMRFILLHDEPTMYAENVNSPQLKINMEVMKNAPKWAIFSSATLPYGDNAKVFIEHHKSRFPNSEYIHNYSTEIYGCCNVKTYDGINITPHLGCSTRSELVNVIKHIIKNPFLGKLYTPISVNKLYDMSLALGKDNKEFMTYVPNITEIFSKVENLYPDKVRKVALDILKTITVLNDEEIARICNNSTGTSIPVNSVIQTNVESNDSQDETDEETETEDDKVPMSIKFENLGTTEAHKFPYLNLIASDKPFDFMKEHYANLVVDIKKRIGSLNKLQSDYEKRLDTWQKEFNSLEKKIKNPDQLSRERDEMLDSKPSISFPDDCQINTKSHVLKYAKQSYLTFGNNKFRIPNILDNIEIDDLHITDDNKLQLLSGVCCYTNPDNIDMDVSYLDTALELTSQKKMETLIADSSICYGTDYPIGGVIITKEFSDTHSLNTIYQLMSRAGRGRKSSNAEIYVDSSFAKNMINTIKQGTNVISIEAENMISVFNSI